jgi:selenocysteine-specific elongation factor
MESVAEVAIHTAKQLAPGQKGFVRMKFTEPILLIPGDHFIIRQFSPVITIGGGTILDSFPAPRLSGSETFLGILASDDRGAVLGARVERRGASGVSIDRLVRETGWTQATIEEELAAALKENRIVRIADACMHAPALAALQQQLLEALAAFHQKSSLAPGIAKEELRAQVKASREIFEALIDRLARERKIELAADFVRLPGQGVAMKDEEAESKKSIEAAFASTGLKVPALNDVIAGLKVDKARASKLVTLLLRDKTLVKISAELVFHHSALAELRRLVAGEKVKSPRMDVAAFKNLTGVSRKYAIPLLEYLDRERVTRRIGDIREIL